MKVPVRLPKKWFEAIGTWNEQVVTWENYVKEEINILQDLGFELEKIASNGDDISDDVKEFKISLESDIWRTGLKMAEMKLNGRYEFDDFKQGVSLSIKASNEEVSQQYDWGTFYLIDKDNLEYSDHMDETALTLHDSMIKTHQEFLANDLGITFPVTVDVLIQALSLYMGIDIQGTWLNGSHEIEENKWENNGLTYRDALDDLAFFTNSTIGVFNDVLMFKQVNQDVVDTIDGGEMSLTHESKWGKPNVLNLTREPQHDNYAFPTDFTEIPKDDRIEVVIENNQIIDKRREELAPALYEQVKTIEYTPFEYTGFGYLTMDYGDYVEFKDKDGMSQYSYITKLEWSVSSGFMEMLGSELTTRAKEEYVLNTDQRRLGLQTYFLVDQQNGIIQGLVNRVDDVEEKTTELTLDVDQIKGQVEGVSFGSILLNGTAEDDTYSYWIDNVLSTPLHHHTGLTFRTGMTNYTIFEPIEDNALLSGWKMSFFANGQTENGLFKVIPEYKYGYRIRRVNGTQPFTLEIKEYDEDRVYLKKQTFTFDEPREYNDIVGVEFSEGTDLVGLNYVITNVDVDDRLELAETMFGIGAPKPYVENVDGVRAWAQSEIQLLKNEIGLKVSQTDFTGNKLVSMINLQPSNIKISSKNIDISGLVTISNLSDGSTTISGSNITTGKIKSQYLEFDNAVGSNVTLSGKITATQGKIAGFDISGDNLVGNNVSIKPNEIMFGNNGKIGISTKTQGQSIAMKNRVLDFGEDTGFNWLFFGGALFAARFESGKTVAQAYRFDATHPDSELGTTGARWSQIYLQNQPNVSSDNRIKSAIQDIPHDLVSRLMEIKPKMYLQGTQWHFGYIAQDVERALYKWATTKYGLEARHYVDKFAVLHKSESHLSLLYGELAVLKEQQMMNRIDELERRLNETN